MSANERNEQFHPKMSAHEETRTRQMSVPERNEQFYTQMSAHERNEQFYTPKWVIKSEMWTKQMSAHELFLYPK